jgi:3'-phosphoadenosine 5'-phosphosulfate sulfotransferase (PAPS reductase)/FAD synthetase
MPARKWMQQHKQRAMGFRLDATGCCRKMKIEPARRAMRAHGFEMQFTGLRGGQDDQMRGFRALRDGAIKYVATDKIVVASPLIGWTDAMIRRYLTRHELTRHPAKAAGAQTIGCIFCAGGTRYTGNSYLILRHTQPEIWRRLIVDLRAGEVLLAVKYDQPLDIIRAAIKELGGLPRLARERPWLFDYATTSPIEGYDRALFDVQDDSGNGSDSEDSARPAAE